VEWDKHCQQVLTYHWPDVPKWWDVSDVNGAELPAVDVITFGSPCQDLSVAGKRAGLEGSRSGLFFEATRIIKEMQDATGNTFPRYAIWENVPGAFNSRNGDDFEAVIQEMADLRAGHIEWHCLDAQFFGVPQRRRRVFVIAVFDSSKFSRSGQPILAVGEGRRRNIKTGKQTRENTTRETSTGTGSGSELASGRDIANCISAELYHRSTIVNQDVNNGHLVINPIVFSHTQGLDAQPSDIASPTLRSNGAGMAVAHDVVHETA
jgi:DNA (cytosine-5)-methyltransferase 1